MLHYKSIKSFITVIIVDDSTIVSKKHVNTILYWYWNMAGFV